jgi:hypothetical protein
VCHAEFGARGVREQHPQSWPRCGNVQFVRLVDTFVDSTQPIPYPGRLGRSRATPVNPGPPSAGSSPPPGSARPRASPTPTGRPSCAPRRPGCWRRVHTDRAEDRALRAGSESHARLDPDRHHQLPSGAAPGSGPRVAGAPTDAMATRRRRN